MKVIVKEPGKLGYEKVISNYQQALQEEVGGALEVVPVNGYLVSIVNKEGHSMGLKPNIMNCVGTIVFCGVQKDKLTDIDDQSAEMLLKGYAPVRIEHDRLSAWDVLPTEEVRHAE